MLRRKWLELLLSASTGVIIARDWLVQSLEASELPSSQDATPTTAAAAIKTQKASSVASFILAYPIVANAATVQEKGTMVSLLSSGSGLTSDIWTTETLRTSQAQYERAALTILRNLQTRPTELAEVVRIAGGQQVAQKRLPLILNSELKTIVQSYVSR